MNGFRAHEAKWVSGYASRIWANHDPAAPLANAMKSAPPQKHRAALREDQLPELFAALASYSGNKATALGLKVIAHTFVRTS